jgi:predicted chitinase
MFLAQLLHESDGLRAKKEYPNPLSEQLYGEYTGRGYIQLSGDYNYKAAGKALGYDYVTEPKLVEEEKHAWLTAAWYWNDQVHKHVSAGFRATTERGIRPFTPHHDSRVRIYWNVCTAFNVSPRM